jgi:hypothetical protein
MNFADKTALKAQLMNLEAQLGLITPQATAGAALPIITPMGPAAAPGLQQLAMSIGTQATITQNLIKLLGTIIDKV